MSGRTLRASVREHLQRAGHNCDMICKHLMKIEQLVIEGDRPDLVKGLEPVGQMAVTLKEILVSLRNTL